MESPDGEARRRPWRKRLRSRWGHVDDVVGTFPVDRDSDGIAVLEHVEPRFVGQERRPLSDCVDLLCRHNGGDFTRDDPSAADELEPTLGVGRSTDGGLRLIVSEPDLIETRGKRFAVGDHRVGQTYAAERRWEG